MRLSIAKRDQARCHTRDDLLKHKVLNSKQHELALEAAKDLKRNYKYIGVTELIETTILTEFMKKLGIPEPVWDPNDTASSLKRVLLWQSKVPAIAKFMQHIVGARRQEITKATKGELACKLQIDAVHLELGTK